MVGYKPNYVAKLDPPDPVGRVTTLEQKEIILALTHVSYADILHIGSPPPPPPTQTPPSFRLFWLLDDWYAWCYINWWCIFEYYTRDEMELVLVDQYCMVTSIHRPARLPYIYVLSTNILVAHPLISYYVLQYYSTLKKWSYIYYLPMYLQLKRI